MNFDGATRTKIKAMGTLGLAIFGSIFVLWFISSWMISPGADEFYVLVRQTGETLPPGKILAGPGQKGVQKELHTAGWGFINPVTWDAERHTMTSIPPGNMGILTAKDGDDLPKGQVLAQIIEGEGPSHIVRCHKGTVEAVLMPGSYRIHPYWFQVEIKPAFTIQPGKVGIVTALTGLPMEPGQILAKPGQRGIQERILEPGTYYLNPYAFKVDEVPAVTVSAGSVGVVTAQQGKPMPSDRLLAQEGERGVREKVLEPGLYFLNPYALKVDPISLRSHRMDLLKEAGGHDDSIEFPSNDGFSITIDAAIEWRIKADRVADVFQRIGNEAAILDNVIRPNARSISRIEGSKYRATDFISGTNREKFELSFYAELSKVCEAKGIEVLRALVRKITVPEDIARPIREAEVARQEKLRNIEQIETQKSAAQLAKEKALVEQQTRQVNAETEKIIRETEAKQQLAVAEIALKTAEKESAAVVTRGKADADVLLLKKKAEAEGFKSVVEAFGGGQSYAMYNFTQMVAQHTSFVFAPVGPGTFWTDPQAFFKMAGAKALSEK